MANKVLTANEAGAYLSDLLPVRTAAQWTNWLGHNRSGARNHGATIPYTQFCGRGTVTYNTDDLDTGAIALMDADAIGKAGGVAVPKIRTKREKKPVVPEVAPAPADLRPGLEAALKIIRSLPEGVSAEHAVMIMLSASA